MPLFKGKASKATPAKAIKYVTRDDKAVIISSLSMDDSRDYTAQFKETCDLYGKGNGRKERKYYHFKLSCDPADNPTHQQSHELAEWIAGYLFPAHECVLATHGDTDTIHTHIIVNAVSFETGKKLRMWRDDYKEAKDLADHFRESMGFTALDWHKKTGEKLDRFFDDEALTADGKYLSSAERNMQKQGNLARDSWKEALRHAIDEAKAHCTTRAEFQKYLESTFGVTMPRNTGKTVSFVHPAVGEKYTIRGAKLGGDYTAAAIDQALHANMERSSLNAGLFTSTEQPAAEHTATIPAVPIIPSQSTSQVRDGEYITPHSISDISAELRSLDETINRITKGVSDGDATTNIGASSDRGATGEKHAPQPRRDECVDRGQRQEPPKPVTKTPKHEPIVHSKPKQRSCNRGR
ncbi:MAG: relaxase/mobilization nuclease domain-containing protein [Defluviitaleaceae bacterium]|nr:relaxase/mobilization nuclease domain-containing protein [Defluviitaleaceae bacterium]